MDLCRCGPNFSGRNSGGSRRSQWEASYLLWEGGPEVRDVGRGGRRGGAGLGEDLWGGVLEAEGGL